jgi:cytochrome c2
MRYLAVFTVLVVSTTNSSAFIAGDAAAGKVAYETRCGSCHAVNENRVGPMHADIVGRPVAALTSYVYSPALSKLGGFWSSCRLDIWLQDPQAMAPGTTMPRVPTTADERRDIITYLATVSEIRSLECP